MSKSLRYHRNSLIETAASEVDRSSTFCKSRNSTDSSGIDGSEVEGLGAQVVARCRRVHAGANPLTFLGGGPAASVKG